MCSSSLQTFNEIQKLLSKTNGKVIGDLMTPAPLVVRETTNLGDAARYHPPLWYPLEPFTGGTQTEKNIQVHWKECLPSCGSFTGYCWRPSTAGFLLLTAPENWYDPFPIPCFGLFLFNPSFLFRDWSIYCAVGGDHHQGPHCEGGPPDEALVRWEDSILDHEGHLPWRYLDTKSYWYV